MTLDGARARHKGKTRMKGYVRLAGLLLGGMVSVCHAATGKEPWEEADKRFNASRKVSALGNNLFGDQISNSNGALSFSVTDVDLPGNNALPVRIARTFTVENRAAEIISGRTGYASDFMLADWDLDLPNISGVYASDWTAGGSAPLNRCSAGKEPPSLTVDAQYISAESYWHGNTAKLLNGGGELLLANSATPKPNTGSTYVWATSDLTYFSCLSSVKNTTGEGFLAIDSNGVKYWFDWMAQYKEPNIKVTYFYSDGGGLTKQGGTYVARRRNVLYPSRIEDRFGNYVTYTYSNAYNEPAKLTAISGSDGRSITLNYNASSQVSSVVAGGHTWSYEYAANGEKDTLALVTLPDASRWTINFADLANTSLSYEPSTAENPSRTCLGDGGPIGQVSYTGTIEHPSGAQGTFVVEAKRHGRSNVPMNCEGFVTPTRRIYAETPYWSYYYYGYSLTSKTISGPGVAAQTWKYAYTDDISHFYPSGSSYSFPVCQSGVDCSAPQCTSDSCAGVSTTTVTSPSGDWTRFTYGNSYRYNEGKLLKVEQGTSGSSTSLSTRTTTYDLSLADKVYPAKRGSSLRTRGDGFTSEYLRPALSNAIIQDGVTYQSTTNTFDAYAKPLSVTRAGLSGSLTDVTTYYDDAARWVLGQTAKVTNSNTGLATSSTTFNSASLPSQVYSFGKLQQTLTYNADGTIATVADGNGRATKLASWKRGIPQSIGFADGSGIGSVVNDDGSVASVTDENGYLTSYAYDAMGRLARVTYPTSDTVTWNATTQTFAQITAAEYGLAAGHWRQVVASGNARKETYFDAFWRPIVSREYDASSASATLRFQRFSYDEEGRQTFASYPGASDSLSAGTWIDYDALGRITSSSQDSEIGLLTTLTTYLTGGGQRTTLPGGWQTTTTFQSYDEPDYSKPLVIQHPEGAYTEITRDVFGKVAAIRRRNADATTSVTRSYVYDAYQQLCKAIEPETGSTAMGYDAAGNLIWTAAGLNLPSTASCDSDTAYAATQRVSRAYDARNRISTLSFQDGNGDQVWAYTSDGKPSQVTTKNDAGAVQVVNAYSYNKRRLLTGESMQQTGGSVWSLGYGYDGNGALAGISYPSGLYVDYAPNALGQPTKAGAYATGVRYYPNGGMIQFVYGNGITHTMTQNARQLPARVTDGSSVLDNSYTYDASGNVTKIADALDSTRTRAMVYDGLDRLTKASSPSFLGDGVITYSYDALDNIKSAKLSGIKEHNYYYDSRNQLTNITANSGATTSGLSYDAQGNLSNKDGQAFAFDYGNRLRLVAGKEAYRYDAYGRRIQSTAIGGGAILSFYGQDGVLRRQNNQRTGSQIEYVSLNGSLVAKVTSQVALSAPTVTAPPYSESGSYSIEWTSSSNATRYELAENSDGTTWTTLYSGDALSASVSGRAQGVYQYRVRACQGTACGDWSAVASTSVALPPTSAPTITVPAKGLSGSYLVGWGTASSATAYTLQESANGGAWTDVYSGPATSKSFSSKDAGSYEYQVQACNGAGCGPASTSGTVTVIYPPTGVPVLTAPSVSTSSTYSVSWTTVSGASEYRVEENFNSAGWVQVGSTSMASLTLSGKAYGGYVYRVLACNEAGCGGYSATASTSVILIPTVAPVLTLASSSTSGTYTVSWASIGGAVEYRLEERANSGSWSEIQVDGASTKTLTSKASATYGYRARACNLAGCGPYSSIASIVVLRIPTAPKVTVPSSSTTGGFTISWSTATDATSYTLREGAGAATYWTEIYTGTAKSYAVTGRGVSNWSYQVKACNASGCSAWSSSAVIAVQATPLATPTGPSVTGSKTLCRVSWGTVSGATYYELMEGSSIAQSSSAVMYTLDAACTATYKVRACNSQICSAWSAGVSK